MSTGDRAYETAVRAVMRQLFERCAASRGLVPHGEVLPTEHEADPVLLAELETGLARFDVSSIEQFGYAYESLLGAADRKHAGAHYTPRALADEVVEHALTPLLDGREVLDLRLLDIATGSGIFLVSAAHFLVGCDPDGPSLREVVTTCLYGADINPTTVEICRLSLWLLAGDSELPLTFLDDRIRCGDSLLDEDIGDRTPVDWVQHAPEVMARGGFDAVIGNPPFLGVKNIRGAVGGQVRDHYAGTLLGGESGRSDLVVFFLARAAQLSAGVVALVVPDAISEGDSAKFGLGRTLAAGYRLYRAETSRPWPGVAGVRIALVWLDRRPGADPVVLDGHEVASIGPGLGRVDAQPRGDRERGVPSWMPHGYQATIVLGKSLVLSRAAATALVDADPRTSAWIKDYLSGEDLVSTLGPTSSRQVLDLGSAELETLRGVPALAPVLDALRIEREAQFAKYPQLVNRWWGFLNPVDRLYAALSGLPEAIALSKHAKYIWPVIVRTGPVFSNGTIVYPSRDRAVYAFLASTPHRLWAVDEGGSRLNQSFRYNPSRLLATYPFPDSVDPARPAGEQLADTVAAAQAALGVGVTELLNHVHRGAPVPAVVTAVRRALVEVDRAVLAAHGLDDPVEHVVNQDGDRSWFGPDRASEAAIKARLLG